MTNQESIDVLLADIRELEGLIVGVRNKEVYAASFFSRTFDLSHRIINNLHAIETEQLELLSYHVAKHQRLMEQLPALHSAELSATELPEEICPAAHPVEEPTPEPEPEDGCPPSMDAVLPEAYCREPEEFPATETPTAPQPNFPELPQENKKEAPEEMTVEQMLYAAIGEKPPVKPQQVSLNDVIEKKKLVDFRKALSLNDRFRFRRELFDENETNMNRAIADLNEMGSYKESVDYLEKELAWNMESPAATDFVKLLEKRFL